MLITSAATRLKLSFNPVWVQNDGMRAWRNLRECAVELSSSTRKFNAYDEKEISSNLSVR